jgi:hypothetical protein
VNVRFFLDSPGTGTPFRVEGTAPWDFNGGADATANPYRVQLPNGAHSITAVLTRPDGTTVSFTSPFSVGTTSTPPPTTVAPATTAAPVTTAPTATTQAPATTAPPAGSNGLLRVSRALNRSGGVALAGNTWRVGEQVYVYLDTTLTAVNVRFFLDSPGTGTPFRVEGTAPWDFNGGAELTANPYNVQLPPGSHSITAVLTRPNGTTVTFSSAFTVTA